MQLSTECLILDIVGSIITHTYGVLLDRRYPKLSINAYINIYFDFHLYVLFLYHRFKARDANTLWDNYKTCYIVCFCGFKTEH